MAYVKTVWQDGPAGGTPINAASLQNIEDAVEATDTQVTTNTADIATLQGDVTALQSGNQGWATKVVGDNDTSVAAGNKIFVDTTGGAFALVLPTTPTNGDTVKFVDAKGNFGTANFTIKVPAGAKLMGTIDDTLVLVANYDFVDMTYFAADDNWIITSKP